MDTGVDPYRDLRLQDENGSVTHARVVQAIDLLAEAGPGLGRPLVDTIHGKERAEQEGGQP